MFQRRKIEIYMCSDTLNGKNLWKICVTHSNGVDPFITLMGNFNWGPISRNDIVSIEKRAVKLRSDIALW